MCRIKVLQLVVTGAAATPLLFYLRGDTVALGEIAGSFMLTSFAGTASAALWFYGQRYVGELALCNEATVDAATVEDEPAAPSRRADVLAVSTGVHEGVVDEPAGVAMGERLWVRMSTLDFWGRRQVCCPTRASGSDE